MTHEKNTIVALPGGKPEFRHSRLEMDPMTTTATTDEFEARTRPYVIAALGRGQQFPLIAFSIGRVYLWRSLEGGGQPYNWPIDALADAPNATFAV